MIDTVVLTTVMVHKNDGACSYFLLQFGRFCLKIVAALILRTYDLFFKLVGVMGVIVSNKAEVL